jgi:endonuclease YncB( thermonuclease family)
VDCLGRRPGEAHSCSSLAALNLFGLCIEKPIREYDTFPRGMPVFSHSFVKSIVVLTLLLSRAPLLSGQDFSGLVVGVSDGDTLSVMHDGKAEKIRLRGIHAPER